VVIVVEDLCKYVVNPVFFCKNNWLQWFFRVHLYVYTVLYFILQFYCINGTHFWLPWHEQELLPCNWSLVN